MKEKKKKIAIAIIMIFLVIGCIFFILTYNKEDNAEDSIHESTLIDVGEVNNVPSVDSKLGDTMKITHSYLLSYTKNKGSIWYMSSAYVKGIKKDGNTSVISLANEDLSKTLNGYIDSDKVNIKKGDTINFVGTIDLETGNINLSKISKDLIDYKSVTEIEFNNLVDNIDAVLSNYFVVSGYMITDDDKYKLFENEKEYEENPNVGNYFSLYWDGDFNYTGNANVTVMCLIGDTFKLKDCSLVE